MVIEALGASPVNRLEIETPSSASRPRPVLARASMIEASSGRLATRTRPRSRSYHRKAGTPSALPMEDRLLAGRGRARHLHGPFVHGVRAGVEPAPQRRHRAGLQHPLHDGEGHAVELDEHDAVHVRVGDLAGLIRSRLAAKDSSVPALTSHASRVPKAAASQGGDRGPERVERRARDDVHGRSA